MKGNTMSHFNLLCQRGDEFFTESLHTATITDGQMVVSAFRPLYASFGVDVLGVKEIEEVEGSFWD